MNRRVRGVIRAVFVFALVGIVLPFVISDFRSFIEKYVTIAPFQQIWEAFLLFGALFAATEYLQTAYVKGNYRWLIGKLGNGVVNLGFFSYIVFGMFNAASLGTGGVQATGLLLLVYLSIGLSYLYVFLDFYDARRTSRIAQE